MKAGAEEYEAASAILRGKPGRVHLMGAGGVGVAALARLLKGLGWRVGGCDLAENSLTRWLASEDIPVGVGHAPDHVAASCDWLIHTAAAPANHPEIRAAAGGGALVTRRGVALAALVRDLDGIVVCGTHGKTTTTAMIAEIARRADPRAGWAIGAETPGRAGVAEPPRDGGPLVVEADESDGTLAFYEPRAAAITNVDFDHMEHFADEREFFAVFRAVVERTRGPLVFGADDARAREIAGARSDAIGCGFDPSSAVRGLAPERFSGGIAFDLEIEGRRRGRVVLPAPGLHNARNALVALGVARARGWPFELARAALAEFRPARRRLERVGEWEGARVYSDYAHHPTEIRALLDAARDIPHRRILAIFQPHRYTRTKALGRDFPPAFEGVERLWLLPVYAASEAPIEGGTSEDLLRHFQRHGRPPAMLTETMDEAWAALRAELRPGDLALLVGAGDIQRLAERAAG